MNSRQAEVKSRLVKWFGSGLVRLSLVIAMVLMSGALQPSYGYAQLTPDGDPNSPQTRMPSLQQIYDKLTTGQSSPTPKGFVGPPSGAIGPTMHSLNDLMALMPEVDDDNCAKPEDVLNGKRYWGLCSDAWGMRTGVASSIDSGPPAPVARTGQTTSYATGDDGTHQTGVDWPNPRFTDNSDGTVTDNLTGLIWLKNANCSANLGGVNKTGALTWANALTWTNALASGSCGLSDGSTAGDWRLPNRNELRSLIDYSRTSGPTIPTGHPFTNVQSSQYWSSSTRGTSTSSAWYVRFSDAYIYNAAKTTSYYVWVVR